MSAEENKALARRFLEEVFNEGNLAAIDELIDPDWVQHDPAMPEKLRWVEGTRQLVEVYHAAFPDVHITTEDQVAEGDKVVDPLDGSRHPPGRADGHTSEWQSGDGLGHEWLCTKITIGC
jgi:predicted SnoaL-like aldol condensation-catalyzing enzyme